MDVASPAPGAGSAWSRRPTGLLQGSPIGPRTRISANEKPRERRVLELELELENECADRVAAAGYRVHQNPTRREISDARRATGDTGKPEKAPEYLIEGHAFDCYTPTIWRPLP
ncbi:hypothetical protein GA0070216_108190 [Micromonospora matsumotoense]|uniref:Uncharacterized protein n=1 Tax=Micromonospora matsumotoense TaxID=121616 RepID=A0A1C4Z619_9ACTN|nr:hypothetical protein GA0070216_108190 [Micromonospora matsumotoense]